MDFTWEDSRQAFRDGAEHFVRTAALVGDRWADPGLGDWDVRALVGHTSRSFLTVEEYLARPAQAVEIAGPADYYRVVRSIATGDAVTQRGRDAGAALGEDPAASVSELGDRVLALLDSCDGSELVTTLVGGMRLDGYLPTRAFELAVHTADLAVALGEPPSVPPTTAAQALAIVSELALADGTAGSLLLAATGRPLPPGGFSVL